MLAAIRSRRVSSPNAKRQAVGTPHGGLRRCYQKSTCLTQLTLGPWVVKIRSRNTQESELTTERCSMRYTLQPLHSFGYAPVQQRAGRNHHMDHLPPRDRERWLRGYDPVGSRIETLIIHKLSSRKFTTQNDIYQQYQSKCVVILIETQLIRYTCLHMRSGAVGTPSARIGYASVPLRVECNRRGAEGS